jgi:hypothetical protein
MKTGASAPEYARWTPQNYKKKHSLQSKHFALSASDYSLMHFGMAWTAALSWGLPHLLGLDIVAGDGHLVGRPGTAVVLEEKKEGIRKPQPKCDLHPSYPLSFYFISLSFALFQKWETKLTSCIVTNLPSMPVSHIPVADKAVHPKPRIRQGSKEDN